MTAVSNVTSQSDLTWPEAHAAYDVLLAEPLDTDRISGWLSRWSDLEKQARGAFVVLQRAVNANAV